MRQIVQGHLWTVAPHVWHAIRPERIEWDAAWQSSLRDERLGEVRLTGRLRSAGGPLVVIVHGLGGDSESRYMLRSASAARALGMSYLRLNLRGADDSGEDVYHAGLTSDLRAVLAHPALASFSDVIVLGWSLGGHLALRWASEPGRDPRVRAVIAVCAPLDLAFGARAILRPFGRPYQWHILRAVKQKARVAAVRRRLPATPEEVDRIETLLEWDERVVVPRFGFASRERYYADASAGPILDRVEVPSLFVAAEHDPMVTADQLHRWLPRASPCVRAVWTDRGGHVAFPDDVDLGVGERGPFEHQVLRWALGRL